MATIYGLQDRFTFGKYNGDKVSAILQLDPTYIIWCDENVSWLGFEAGIVEQAKGGAKKAPDARFKKIGERPVGSKRPPDPPREYYTGAQPPWEDPKDDLDLDKIDGRPHLRDVANHFIDKTPLGMWG